MEKTRLIEIKNYLIQHKIADEDWFKYGTLDGEVMFEDWSYEDMVVRTESAFYYNDLGCCGCYCPDDVREVMLIVLHNCSERNQVNFDAIRFILHDDPYAQFMFYILNDKGYLDHGSSISGSWTTDKGRMYMEVLMAYTSIDDYDGVFR